MQPNGIEVQRARFDLISVYFPVWAIDKFSSRPSLQYHRKMASTESVAGAMVAAFASSLVPFRRNQPSILACPTSTLLRPHACPAGQN